MFIFVYAFFHILFYCKIKKRHTKIETKWKLIGRQRQNLQ